MNCVARSALLGVRKSALFMEMHSGSGYIILVE